MDADAARLGPLVADKTVPFPAHQPLQGFTTTLVPLEPAHAPSLFKHMGGKENDDLWSYLPTEGFNTLEQTTEIITSFSKSKDPLYWAILSGPSSDEESEAIGFISYLNILPSHRRIEIGWVAYSRALQRTKRATEVMRILMAHAFDDLGYERVEWKANSLNAGSRAAALRLGFVYEGLFRKHIVFKGRRRDTAWFSCTDEEWPLVRSGLEGWLEDGNFDADGRQIRGLREIREAEAAKVAQ
ncbi:hypothetical protein N3K66_002941 [Trichothecium roseum]|uniref:Uncharacterized protein n=1 Tax=Trichothecium roseum TaxID=47278 RepID=A0ACC0V5L5_9HYPO|nr:hypothetical protein N3K66_002941 [Trichothecium roseum]